MPIHHITLAVRGRRALARGEGERRALVRRLVGLGQERLLLFCLVDDHLHCVVRGERARYLARDMGRALVAVRDELELKPASVEPVGSRAHLSSLVRYLLRQPSKHQLPVHPALWSGSCFQDLVGARALPGFSPGVLASELPRLQSRELFEAVGLEPWPLSPAGDEALRRAGPARLVALAAGVHGAEPELRGRASQVVAARTLAAGVARRLEIPSWEIARYAGATPQTVRRLARRSLEAGALGALRRRLALELRSKRG